MNEKSNTHLDSVEKESQRRASLLKRLAVAIITIAFIGVFTLPLAVVNWSFGYDLGTFKPNEIGDTIGGILSPFIGLVSAVLIYITIDQQIEANRKIQGQIDQVRLDKLEELIFEETKKELEKLRLKLDRLEDRVIDEINSNQDYINPCGECMNYLIFKETSDYYFDIENRSLALKRNLHEFVRIMNLFSEKVKRQDAYLIIIKKIAEGILPFFDSYMLNNILNPIHVAVKSPKFPKNFLNLENLDTLKVVLNCMKLEKYVFDQISDNNQDKLIKLQEKIDLFDEVIFDVSSNKFYIDMLNMPKFNKFSENDDLDLRQGYKRFQADILIKGWYGIEEKED